MVFMEDSERAAQLAREGNIEVGLHLNFTEKLHRKSGYALLEIYHEEIRKYINRNNFNWVIYNPLLHRQFDYVFKAQRDEFMRLYGVSPTHYDGHHHMHLSANVLVGNYVPAGARLRRSFSYNRVETPRCKWLTRTMIDAWISRRYIVTDYFYSLAERIDKNMVMEVRDLAKSASIELEVHPERKEEYGWLMNNENAEWIIALSKRCRSECIS